MLGIKMRKIYYFKIARKIFVKGTLQSHLFANKLMIQLIIKFTKFFVTNK